jgi:Phosphotransferase enzyme family
MTAARDLDALVDCAAMQAQLQACLPGFAEGRLRIDTLRVSSVRRNTSQQRNPRRMTLCYEMQVCEPASGRSGAQWLFAEVFRDGADAIAPAGRERERLTAPAFGEALVFLPHLGMLLWALPNDPGLPQLATLLDPLRAAAVVPGAGAAGVQPELLRYVPQQRATLRYTVPGGTGATPRQVYAKTFHEGGAEVVDACFRHFWQAAQLDRAAPLVAQPLGRDDSLRTVWQAPASGVPLRDTLAHADALRHMAGVARALARVHDAPLAPGATARPRSVAHWVAEVGRRREKISRVSAAFAARASRIAEAIQSQADRQAQRPLSLIHGDWHPDQVWVHDERVLLFDFDEFTLGDPMEDLAEFVVKLEQHATPAPRTSLLASTLIAHYQAAAPQRFDRAALAWHLAIQSLLQASRAFVYQQPGWSNTLERRLAACEVRTAALLTT